MTQFETQFWNSGEIVDYFADKPADPIVIERVAQVPDAYGKRALDLGCGGGRHSEMLASMGFAVTSVDLNPAMLAHTEDRLATRGLETTTGQMSIVDLDLENESFDVIVSTGVLHQAKSLAEYQAALSEVSRVLRSDGLFTMNIFTNAAWDETYNVPDPAEPFTVLTKERLWMTLLSKDLFYHMASQHGLMLEQEVREDVRQENTGPRAVLRAHLRKVA